MDWVRVCGGEDVKDFGEGGGTFPEPGDEDESWFCHCGFWTKSAVEDERYVEISEVERQLTSKKLANKSKKLKCFGNGRPDFSFRMYANSHLP